jgi:hypothetical protein
MTRPQVVLRVSFVVDDPNLQVNPSHPKRPLKELAISELRSKDHAKELQKKGKRMDSHCFLDDFLLFLR